MLLTLQTDLDSPLDLSGFACHRVSVSFRVASEHGLSDYSPTAELCIGGGETSAKFTLSTIQSLFLLTILEMAISRHFLALS